MRLRVLLMLLIDFTKVVENVYVYKTLGIYFSVHSHLKRYFGSSVFLFLQRRGSLCRAFPLSDGDGERLSRVGECALSGRRGCLVQATKKNGSESIGAALYVIKLFFPVYKTWASA